MPAEIGHGAVGPLRRVETEPVGAAVPFAFVGPWHLKQLFDRIGLMSRLKLIAGESPATATLPARAIAAAQRGAALLPVP